MVETIKFNNKHISKAYLHRVDDRLVVWLDGGHCNAPLTNSLGKDIRRGLNTPCSVLIPQLHTAAGSAKSLNCKELRELIEKCGEWSKISICGWSLGSDGTALLVKESPAMWERVCLISNYSKQWDKCYETIKSPVRVLVGAKEKSGSIHRDWSILDKISDGKLYRVSPYDHLVGDKIWIDKRYCVLSWLCGDADEPII